jgi:hypothetical protein
LDSSSYRRIEFDQAWTSTDINIIVMDGPLPSNDRGRVLLERIR